MNKKIINKMTICPACGSSNFIPIVYGESSEDGIEKQRKGEIILGGYISDPDRKKFRCKDCSIIKIRIQ